ncbi:PREDICTED: uncharacterized protein LOC109168971 [Ipomoea nil]|uniref:uncharacterized protein LOC109168971 n=1 Tax=Ipomoea nil TaxID=35883 RepID=UPI0009012CB1|nr:PREDICTED: uncharacterized protein LOC109168971 [Ipomoea nil]
MVDAVRNIIIKLGRKNHSPESARKHVNTLLQLAMKKKLKLDTVLRDEILIMVISDYPEFYENWSDDDASNLLLMASEADDDISPASIDEPEDGNRAGAFLKFFAQRALEWEEISRRRAEAHPLYLEVAQEEAKRRIEFLQNRSNTSDTSIQISPDKPSELLSVDDEFELPIEKSDISPESAELLLPAKPIISDDSPQLLIVKSESVKTVLVTKSEGIVPNFDDIEKLSLVVYSSDVDRSVVSVNPESTLSDKPSVEKCPVENPQKESVVTIAEQSIDGVPVYTSSNLAESLDHIRHFAGLPSASIPEPYKTVTSICSYSKLLTYEFYCNLNEDIDNLTSEKCQQIFIRGKWYVFEPDMINQYYGLKTVEEEEIFDWDLVAKTLTGGLTPVWPTGDNDTLSSSQFTSKFVILHRIALHNWLPSAHFHTVGKNLTALLFRVGTKMTIDLGRWIFYHILTLIHPREQKGLIPMQSEIIGPSLLYTVDPRLLTGKHIRDVTPVDAPHTSEADTAVEDTPYARDVQLSLRLKARVSELETVSNIISNQLNAARTGLATFLLRMRLSESAAADNVKTDSEGPSNA